jgi:hypothetical protein
MVLTRLSKDELNEEFLNVNAEYIRMSSGQPHTYMNKPEFLKIREKLRAILSEFQRRREQG